MKYIYCLHNKFVGFYVQPFVADVGKEDIAEQMRRSIWLDIETAKKNALDECELVYLGTFDDTSGDVSLSSDKEVVADLASFYAQRLKFEKGESL